MTRIAAGLVSLLAAACSCEGEVGRPARPGFADETIELCASGTAGVAVRTRRGGTFQIAIVDACGEVLASCTTPDVFAADAVATIRIAGEELIAEGCVLAAGEGTTVRARFLPADGGEEDVESYDARLVRCRDGGTPGRDAGTCARQDGGRRDGG